MFRPRVLPQRRHRFRLPLARAIALLPLLVVAPAGAEDAPPPVFQSDFGGVGLLQTPTARMAPVGEFSFTYSQVDPYTHFAFSLQPFKWMEAGFRYTSIDNRLFGRSIAGDRDFLDKGVDLKLALVNESRYIPKIAVGFRDFGGTGLFGSEYLVANKRWYNLDFSLGVGWGYVGSRGDIDNPLRVFGDRFEERIGERSDTGGDFNIRQLFTGPVSLFGGIQYQTPWKPLTLQLEYDGNDYQSEPLNNDQEQDSPFNFGARYRVNDHFTLSAAWERGDTAMLGATLSLNFATLTQPKNDPPPVVPKRTDDNATDDWEGVASRLSQNAGISAQRITREGDALVVEGIPTKYRSVPETELRANRILHNVADADIKRFHYRWRGGGFYLREDILPRAPLPEEPLLLEPAQTFSDADYRYGVASIASSASRVSPDAGTTLYESIGDRFTWNLGPALVQNFGGPDGYLYQILARLDTLFKTDDHGWFSSTLGYVLVGNFDKFDFIAESDLPRVRTFVGRYAEETDLGLFNLQYTRTARLSDNWFGMAYGGYLEQMYAGAGAEVLYRPFNSPVAIGVDANWVRQRDFDTQFGLRDYSTWVGNVTAYVETGIKDVLASVSVGRYLAQDIGATVDFSREFESGVRLGAFATFTDAGDDFGEGGFDKGIYLTVPLDLFFTKSSRRYASVAWKPLTRDGGAKLGRRYNLYSLTNQRSLTHYWENYQDALQ